MKNLSALATLKSSKEEQEEERREFSIIRRKMRISFILAASFVSKSLKSFKHIPQSITTRNKFIQTKSGRIVKSAVMENQQRTFSLNDYDCIGFDLDNTIVKYKVKNMIYHEYNAMAELLVQKGYSKEFLLKPIEEDVDFLQKGLILDFERGNLLRVCPDGTIQIASHGSKFLTREEIIKIYGENRRWKVTDEYCKDMLVAWNGTLADSIRTCLDYFDMPAALLFARIIDSIDLEKGGVQEKYNIWPDVLGK